MKREIVINLRQQRSVQSTSKFTSVITGLSFWRKRCGTVIALSLTGESASIGRCHHLSKACMKLITLYFYKECLAIICTPRSKYLDKHKLFIQHLGGIYSVKTTLEYNSSIYLLHFFELCISDVSWKMLAWYLYLHFSGRTSNDRETFH